jgi:tripartite-type tricarboxylate transporter receptor subunit TctC
VVVENRAGAGGNVGMEYVAQSAPDGHTLLMSYVGSHAINASLYKKLPFDPEKDFAPVATLATLPFVLVARPDAPFKSVKELAEQGKKTPLTFGSAGNGSVNHLLGVMFNSAAGTKLEHIPYRGAAPAMQDLLGGQINLVFTSLPSVAGSIKNGSLRAIAVTSGARSSNFPTIPTIAEAGVKGYESSTWYGIVAPIETPQPIQSLLNKEMVLILKDPELRKIYDEEGLELVGNTQLEFKTFIQKEIDKWRKVAASAGLKKEPKPNTNK